MQRRTLRRWGRAGHSATCCATTCRSGRPNDQIAMARNGSDSGLAMRHCIKLHRAPQHRLQHTGRSRCIPTTLQNLRAIPAGRSSPAQPRCCWLLPACRAGEQVASAEGPAGRLPKPAGDAQRRARGPSPCTGARRLPRPASGQPQAQPQLQARTAALPHSQPCLHLMPAPQQPPGTHCSLSPLVSWCIQSMKPSVRDSWDW
jgi:hypothetical protein